MRDKIVYIKKKLEQISYIDISDHAIKRASLRGIEPEKIRKSLYNGEIIGVRDNENPNLEIEYRESYKVLIQSNDLLPRLKSGVSGQRQPSVVL